MRGWLVAIGRDQAKKLPQGSYYEYELIGLKVFSGPERCLGEITEVLATGGNDVYVVRHENGEILIPALKRIVTRVDVKQGRMEVTLPEGLL